MKSPFPHDGHDKFNAEHPPVDGVDLRPLEKKKRPGTVEHPWEWDRGQGNEHKSSANAGQTFRTVREGSFRI